MAQVALAGTGRGNDAEVRVIVLELLQMPHRPGVELVGREIVDNPEHVVRRAVATGAAIVGIGLFVERPHSVVACSREESVEGAELPRRLEAEAIRDSMLAVSGLLDPTLYGPGSLDPDMRRRSIYFFIKRSQLIPMMMLFDWPEHLVGIGERSTTTIAPQALLMMNSPQTRQYAVGLAERLGDGTEEERIEQAYWIVLGRAPTAEEHRVAAQFLEQQTATYLPDHDSGASGLARVDLCQTLLSLNEFLYIE